MRSFVMFSGYYSIFDTKNSKEIIEDVLGPQSDLKAGLLSWKKHKVFWSVKQMNIYTYHWEDTLFFN